MTTCNQCGKPAVKTVAGHPLCVACFSIWQQAEQLGFARNVALLNFTAAQAEAVTGIAGLVPRMQMPLSPIHTGDMTLHNIQVDRSVVGTINTGQIEQLDVAMSNIKDGGDLGTAEALQVFTQAVIDAADADAIAKGDMLEHLACIAEQLAKPPTQRSPSVMKTVLAGLKSLASGIASLTKLYDVFTKHIDPQIG